MTSAIGALYEPLIERDLAAVDEAVRRFRADHSVDDLWLAITRFAVLAYSPSQHAKHAVLACLAAHDLREELGEERFDALLSECARYAAASRQPWSEPPILNPPAIDATQPRDLDELRAAIAAGDRHRGERWLAARVDDAGDDLLLASADDPESRATIVVRAVLRLAELLGDKGRYAILRVAIWELVATGATQSQTLASSSSREQILATLINRASRERGSIETIHDLLLFDSALDTVAESAILAHLAKLPDEAAQSRPSTTTPQIPIDHLARDYAQTLLAHAAAKRLHAHFPDGNLELMLAAAHDNRQNGDNFEEWSFA